MCCSAHPLPFNLVEDKVFQWAYNCPVKDRRRISIRVTEPARDWREKICGSFPGKFFTILLDGWTNPLTRQSHMCYMHVLPSTNLEVFKAEATEIEDVKNLGQPVVPANFRIHKTLANLTLKVVVSEACVERAFSRHKLFHSNLRANLKSLTSSCF